MSLTVWSVYWGDKYDKAYVYALKEAVEKNLTVKHTFKCITTNTFPGINTVKPQVCWRGWWQKLGLFNIAKGPSLYFDLDVVITGNIDYLVGYTDCKIAAPSNWAQSGHGGVQSSVMAWDGSWHEPYEKFNYPADIERLWGDQEFLTELLDDWEKIPGIGSYKYHAKNGIPDWMNVCVFHGKPDPHEVQDPWISSYTQTLRSLISENTRNGSSKGLQSTG